MSEPDGKPFDVPERDLLGQLVCFHPGCYQKVTTVSKGVGSCDTHTGVGTGAPAITPDMVEHPPHYGGKDNPYEVIKVLEAWGLTTNAYLWNVVKYVARSGKKGTALEDLKKARFYLNKAIEERERDA